MVSPKTGYLQSVDENAILELAIERNCLIYMVASIGGLAIEDTTFACIRAQEKLQRDSLEVFQGNYCIGRYRSVDQDAAFGIRQIVDIALRALSPGSNDTTTAVM